MKKRIKTKAFLRRRLIVFLILAGILVIVSLIAPMICPNDPNATSATAMNQAPSAQYPFGTDRYGRDMLSRVIVGSRASIYSTLLLVAIITVIGTGIGVFCGWHGKWIDTVLMRISDVMLAFPQMVIAIAVAGILGGGMGNAMLAMGITGWTLYARLARAQVLAMKEEPYVHAARLTGCSGFTIMVKTLLPNLLGPMLVTAATQIGVMMIGIAGLSFLGIGVSEPQAEWGSMINGSRAYLQLAPWAVLAPAIATIITVMIFNYLGDCVRDALDTGEAGR